MSPEQYTALQEPHLWTLDRVAPNYVNMIHPNGVVVMLRRSQDDAQWLLNLQRELHVVSIPRKSQLPGLPGALADIQQVMGPGPRVRLNRLLLQIQAWALEYPERGCLRLKRKTERKTAWGDLYVLFSPSMVHRRMPVPLEAAWRQLRHVLAPPVEGRYRDTIAEIWIDQPVTAHEMLAFRQSLHDAGRAEPDDLPAPLPVFVHDFPRPTDQNVPDWWT